MEKRAGNNAAAQEVYRRAVRESITKAEDGETQDELDIASMARVAGNKDATDVTDDSKKEFEVVRWDRGSSMKGEVWMNDGSVEGKVPKAAMEKLKAKKGISSFTS